MCDVITSTKNDTVKAARRLKLKKGRADSGLYLVEGVKCVNELLAHRPSELQTLFVNGDSFGDMVLAAQQLGVQICDVTDSVMNAICDCKTPQGIVATARIPMQKCNVRGFIVALDHVQDPSNLGTIIRTADAGGVSCVVLSEGCADPYAPKAVRASMGSLFHLPVIPADLPYYLRTLRDDGYEIAGAHLDGQAEYHLDWRNTCLVIGNESRGLSEDVQKLVTQLIRIPMFGKAESLNAAVAAGILIYKIRT